MTRINKHRLMVITDEKCTRQGGGGQWQLIANRTRTYPAFLGALRPACNTTAFKFVGHYGFRE